VATVHHLPHCRIHTGHCCCRCCCTQQEHYHHLVPVHKMNADSTGQNKYVSVMRRGHRQLHPHGSPLQILNSQGEFEAATCTTVYYSAKAVVLLNCFLTSMCFARAFVYLTPQAVCAFTPQ
jgi:hypothetical protein